MTVVAVDGPSASGKSTISRMLAQRLGFIYVDSGAMYRTVTWKALEEGLDVNDTAQVIAMLDRIRIHFDICDQQVRMFIDGIFPGETVREPRVAEKVSIVAAIPEVRRVLVAHQRSLTQFGSLVMEGRDIGSVVFPNTPHKFYIDANPEERAKRRRKDFEAMQIATSTDGVAQALAQRDKLDSTRATSPLQVAPGATVVDNSINPPERTVEIILEQITRQQRAQ
ncbi:MAG: (d)CMP kinase [Verrucomicrobia bacterium]|nr:(d)CMP kinase [Verrucomicrobiota bacterium]